MRDNYTHITFVVDTSGSMQSMKEAAESGFKELLDAQRKEEGDATVSVYTFNSADNFKNLRNFEEISRVHDFEIVPEGVTALFDAVGNAIHHTGKHLEKLDEWLRPSKVIFVIISDGLENASIRETLQSMRSKIKHQTDVYKWEFVYVGANQDAFGNAERYNIPHRNTVAWDFSERGTQVAYAAASATISSLRNNKSENDRPLGSAS